MNFSRRKLPKEALEQLYRVKITTIKPYELMIAPVYVYLRTNEKFVAVKAPLDFFTEKEITKLARCEYFYFPEFINTAIPFRDAGQKLRAILGQQPSSSSRANEDDYPEVTLPPAPYELADAALKIVGPLWWLYPGQGFGIEPFLVSVFVNELCSPIPSDKLQLARDQDIEKLDRALFRSSWVVFLALHLGYCDLSYLSQTRIRIFSEMFTEKSDEPAPPIQNEADELIELAKVSLGTNRFKIVKGDFFRNRPERVSQMLLFRMNRIKKELVSDGPLPPTILGERGFLDV